MSFKPTPILFLDLDGTVRKGFDEIGKFVNGPEDVEIFDGVVDILKSYKANGWRIIAITNQGGIALGHVSESKVKAAVRETNRQCSSLFDEMYYCPHHPNAKGDDVLSTEEKSVCFCRKPSIGLVVGATFSLAMDYPEEEYRPYACLFVGDRDEDRQCALNASIPFMSAAEWRKAGPLL